jgi:hypothetical protein
MVWIFLPAALAAGKKRQKRFMCFYVEPAVAPGLDKNQTALQLDKK